MNLTEKELKQRISLKDKKPLVYEKIIKISERSEKNIPTPMIDIAYDFTCDLKCAHCSIAKISSKKNKLTIEKLREITTEADKLGLCQLTLSGGEPLLFTDLDQVVEAMQPDKFHIKMSTHGRHLSPEMVVRLEKLGIDKVSISMDQFHGLSTKTFTKDQYPKNLKAIFMLKESSIDPVMTTVVSHQNCREQYFIDLLEFATEHNIKVDTYIAKPIGQWQNNFDVMINREDYAYLEELHKKYPIFFLDTFSSYRTTGSCIAIRGTLHITPYGDVFPCGFMQVSIGNLFEESLKDIIKRGMNITYFNKASPICLSGRNKSFMEKISVNSADGSFPPTWKDVFIDDFVN